MDAAHITGISWHKIVFRKSLRDLKSMQSLKWLWFCPHHLKTDIVVLFSLLSCLLCHGKWNYMESSWKSVCCEFKSGWTLGSRNYNRESECKSPEGEKKQSLYLNIIIYIFCYSNYVNWNYNLILPNYTLYYKAQL